MGWLSDTLGGIGDFFGVGDLFGGIGGGLDYAQQRKDSKKAQMRQYEQALYMSNTAHQREVADLRAAGLNPVLSVMGGSGASSAMPSVSQLPHSDSSGVARAQLREQKRLNSAAIEKSAAEAASARAVAANQEEQAQSEAVRRNFQEQQLEQLARKNAFIAKLPPELRNQAIALEMFGSSVLSTVLGQGYAAPQSAGSFFGRLKDFWDGNWNHNLPASRATSSARKLDSYTDKILRNEKYKERESKAVNPVGAKHIDYKDLQRMKKPIKGPVVIHFD